MRILLINPGQYLPIGINQPLNAFQPLGLGYLAGILLKNNYQVTILDALAEGYDQESQLGGFRYVGLPQKIIKSKIRKYAPGVVGITAPFTAQAKAAHDMAAIVKTVNPKVKVVIGGSYPTIYADTILNDNNLDFAVRGEGELTLLELVKELGNKKPNFENVKGLIFRKNNKLIINPPQSLLTNLDNYGVAWELLPMDKYFQAAYQVKSSRSISTFGKRWATIFTSRGCPYRCTFCVGHEVMGRVWRPRSPENVIKEMDYLINRYRIQHFDIEDDNFTLNKNRAKQICRMLIEKKWPIKWSLPNGVRADTMDKELVKLMAQAGCSLMVVAPESGDQKVVNQLMNKNINLKKINQVVKWGKQFGIIINAFFLIGMPGETEKQIRKTIYFAKKLRQLGADECGFGVVVPHRGTEVYNMAIKNGWLRKDLHKGQLVEGLMVGEPWLETPQLSIARTKQLLKEAVRVNPLIPVSRLKLIVLMFIKTPSRFFKLTFSELGKRLGFNGGILGA